MAITIEHDWTLDATSSRMPSLLLLQQLLHRHLHQSICDGYMNIPQYTNICGIVANVHIAGWQTPWGLNFVLHLCLLRRLLKPLCLFFP